MPAGRVTTDPEHLKVVVELLSSLLSSLLAVTYTTVDSLLWSHSLAWGYLEASVVVVRVTLVKLKLVVVLCSTNWGPDRVTLVELWEGSLTSLKSLL